MNSRSLIIGTLALLSSTVNFAIGNTFSNQLKSKIGPVQHFTHHQQQASSETPISGSNSENSFPAHPRRTINLQPEQFIIEFEQEPVMTTVNTYRKTHKGKSTLSEFKAGLKARVAEQESRIATQHQALQRFAERHNLVSNVLNKHTKLLNALVVKSTEKNIALLAKQPGVKRVVPVSKVQANLERSVPLINADDYWQLSDSNGNALTGTGITVAVLDTGVDYTHPVLGGCFGEGCKVTSGYDFINNDDDPIDDHGHGTHVAGIVAANGNYQGVAPDASIMAVKVLDEDGGSVDYSVINGIEYAVDPDNNPLTDDGADIINMSLGGFGDANSPLSVATNNAVEQGAIVVVAAGNEGNYGEIRRTSPASAEKAITVSSSTKGDNISDFSSIGGVSDSRNLKPEIIAPGSDIMSAFLRGLDLSFSGTSMASPHVAGAAALLLQTHPSYSPAQIKGKLLAGAQDIGLTPLEQGFGRLDLMGAYESDIILLEANLSLGHLPIDTLDYEYDGHIILENTSETATEISINLPETETGIITIATPSDTLEIAAGEQITIPVSVSIPDASAILASQHRTASYTWSIAINSDTQQINVPVVVERGHVIEVSNTTNHFVFVKLSDDFGFTPLLTFLSPGVSIKTIVPDIELKGTFIHLEVSMDEVNYLSLPQYGDEKPVIIDGYEGYQWSVNSDMQINISSDNFTAVTALTESTEQPIETSKIASQHGYFSFQSEVEGRETSTQSYTILPRTYRSDDAEEASPIAVILRGATIDKIEGQFSIVHKLPAQTSGDSDLFIQTMSNLENTEDELASLDENQINQVYFQLNPALQVEAFGVMPHDQSFVFADRPLYSETAQIRFYSHAFQGASDATTLFQGTIHPEFGFLEPVIESPKLYFSETSWAEDVDSTKLLIQRNDYLDFSTNGAALTAEFVRTFEPDRWWGYGASRLQTILGYKVWDGAYPGYQQLCGNTIVSEGSLSPDWEVPIQECDNKGLRVNWSSSQSENSLDSYALFQEIGDYHANFEGMRLLLLENDQLKTDNVILSESGQLLIASGEDGEVLPIDSVQYSTDTEEWHNMDIVDIDNDHHYWSQGFTKAVYLPEPGVTQQMLSIRVNYSSIDYQGSQTLYNLVRLGSSDTDPGADLDGDGIINRLDDDTDGDGMSDAFELEHGLNVYDAADASSDSDADGLSNLDEYYAGTDPTRSDSDNDGIDDAQDPTPTGPVLAARLDFNSDGSSDIALVDNASAELLTRLSNSGDVSFTDLEAQPGDIPLFGDFDGDGIEDIALRRPATQYWYIHNSSGIDALTNYQDGITRIRFGQQSADIPVPADYDGDGKTDIAVRRPSTQLWYILNSSGTDALTGFDDGITRFRFGKHPDDIPVVADYDGDGSADIAVRRPHTQTWYILNSSGTDAVTDFSDGITRVKFGLQSTDIPVVADYDGDGKADLSVLRPERGIWYVRNSGASNYNSARVDGIQRTSVDYQPGDMPIVADYDGDGIADFALHRPQQSTQHIRSSLQGEWIQVEFDAPMEAIPLAAPIQIKMAMAGLQ